MKKETINQVVDKYSSVLFGLFIEYLVRQPIEWRIGELYPNPKVNYPTRDLVSNNRESHLFVKTYFEEICGVLIEGGGRTNSCVDYDISIKRLVIDFFDEKTEDFYFRLFVQRGYRPQ